MIEILERKIYYWELQKNNAEPNSYYYYYCVGVIQGLQMAKESYK